MIFKYKPNNRLTRQILLTILMGGLSFAFGLVKFYVPGLEGTGSDFREIPLLVGVFYLSNPLLVIIMSAITSIGAISINSFWPTFISHSIGLIVTWYVYQFVKKKRLNSVFLGFFWFAYISFYFLLLVAPLIVLLNYSFGLNKGIPIWCAYSKFAISLGFEILSTVLVTTLYLILHKVRIELKKHKQNLEQLVVKRTKELQTSNKELNKKNNIIKKQNDELRNTLTNLKETQSQLLQAEKMASIGTLMAGISHEINNPLNYIIGSYWGLNKYFKEFGSFDRSRTQTLMKGIKVGVDKASIIIQELNHFSGSVRTYDQNCNLHFIIDNCAVVLGNIFGHRIKINKVFCDEECYVKGNISKLHQAMMDLLTNACQAIYEEGQVWLRTHKLHDRIELEIEDNGCGIEKEHLSQISDPFFTTKSPGKGTGLGLSTVYAIIKEHQGHITFESEPQKGTKVTLLFPSLSFKELV